MKFASIVISAWNRPKLLQTCLNSLWQKTTYPYELIVHDDGSDKDTSDWLHSLLLSGGISTLISNPPGHNRGHGTSVNRAVDLSEGDPIIKLNGDEVFADGWLEKAIKAFDLFPEIGLLHLAYYYNTAPSCNKIDGITWQLGEWTLAKFTREGISIQVVWVGPGCGFAWTRKTWLEKGKWQATPDPRFLEDMEYRLRICPMMRLFRETKDFDHPPVTNTLSHWHKYQNTPWLAVLDPPVISYHPGAGLCSIGDSLKTLKDGPFLLGGK